MKTKIIISFVFLLNLTGCAELEETSQAADKPYTSADCQNQQSGCRYGASPSWQNAF
ncbi:hypothetical protein [Pseudomonas sp. UBA2684]|uniref:hypothetical protein n=1 Tax=Pseudomonas sp. UBA2684 TaxID=1947311 RepID=UPI0025FD7605|nr:hypothetical protein [Pseudomonas sp. UBA2684]